MSNRNATTSKSMRRAKGASNKSAIVPAETKAKPKPGRQERRRAARYKRDLESIAFWSREVLKTVEALSECKRAVTTDSFQICSGLDRSAQTIGRYFTNSGVFDNILFNLKNRLQTIKRLSSTNPTEDAEVVDAS